MEFLNRKNFREINNITFYFSVISFVKIISIIYLSYPIINSIFYRFYLKIIDQSLFPYQDFYFEYPPLLALMTSFPFGLIKIKNEFEYFAYFNFYLIIFELISMKISFKILTKINNNQIELLKEKRFYLTWAV